MRNVFRLLALVAVMMTVTTVFAHHSFGATYDTSIHVLTDAVRKARVGRTEKTDALRRLAKFERH